MKTTSPKKSASKIAEAKTEQKLNEILEINQKQFENVLLHSPNIFIILEGFPEMIITFANEPLFRSWGKTAAIIGKPLMEVVPEIKDQTFPALLQQVFETGKTHYSTEEKAVIHINGNPSDKYYNYVYQPILNENQKVTGVTVMATDITELVFSRKTVEESETLFRLALFLTAKTVFKQDTQLKYTWIYNTHPSFEMKDLMGKTDREILNNDTAEILTTIKQTVLNTGKTFTGEIELEIDGKAGDFIIRVEATKDSVGKINGIIAVSEDITEKKQVEKKITESEKQNAYLLKLSDALRSFGKPAEIEGTATKIAMDFMDADRCYYCTREEGNAIILRDAFREGLTSLAAVYAVSDFSDLMAAIDSGNPFVIDDVNNSEIVEDGLKQMCTQVQVLSMINVPVIKNGKTVGVFVLAQSKPRKWTQGEVQLCVETTERIWAAVERAKTEEALYQSEEKYRSLFTSIDQGFSLCELIRNKDGKGIDVCVLEVNPTYEQQTGIKKEMMIGKNLMQVFPSSHNWIETYTDMVDNQRPIVFESYFEGTDRWFAIKAYPVEKEKFAVLFNDITSQKQASQYARSLIEVSLDPLVTINADGKITDVNEASIKVTGVEREKLIDTDFSNYFTEPEKAQEGYQQVFEKGFVADYPLTIKHKNGNLTDVLYNASIYKDDKGYVLGVFAAARDVTERKMFEKEMIDAKEFAENATKSKQQFLSNMSHEIRTPLNSILGFTNVLLKTELGLQQKEFVEAISTSGKSLNLLINDILDLAKVDAGKMTFETKPFEIRKSTIAILHSFDMKIKEKNLELVEEYDYKIPSILVGDSLRLNQIILNLISNAVKFTDKGKIKLSIKLLHEDKENVTIEFVVTDSGIGIAANKLNSLFNIFEQAEINTSTSYGGTGLGLSIVKQLVECQGGSVSVKSKLGEGSAFNFTLSFGKTNLKIEEEIILIKPNSEIKNLRVLVAEDVALNQLLIKIILIDFGFEYDIVDNGKLAIEKMQTNTYDIILMDLQMPKMNGYEATEYIRKTLKSHIPIIALTADVTTMDISKCKEFGMDSYISKPIEEKLLFSKIVELVKKIK